MKVVFLESVEGTAQVGEIKEVKSGFARNYLLPRRLAAPAVEPYLRRAEARAAREEKKQVALDQDASAVAERVEGARITLEARVGEQGKLYGSVTSVHIAEEVAKLMGGEEFDHRKVLLPEAIKEVGVHPVRLRLTRNVEAAIEVEVLAEGVEEEAVEEEQPEAASEEEADAGSTDEEQPQAELEEETEAGSAEEEQPQAELEEMGDAEEQLSEEQQEEPEKEQT
jgi:large subunit ribosomal protein L9